MHSYVFFLIFHVYHFKGKAIFYNNAYVKINAKKALIYSLIKFIFFKAHNRKHLSYIKKNDRVQREVGSIGVKVFASYPTSPIVNSRTTQSPLNMPRVYA